MPFADPERKRAYNRNWILANYGSYAAEKAQRVAKLTEEQREAVRARDRTRKRRGRALSSEDAKEQDD